MQNLWRCRCRRVVDLKLPNNNDQGKPPVSALVKLACLQSKAKQRKSKKRKKCWMKYVEGLLLRNVPSFLSFTKVTDSLSSGR